MNERLRAFQAFVKREIALGQDVETGQTFHVPLDALKQTHLHVIGPSGGGKTRWVMGLILQLIALGERLIVMSVHPDITDFTLAAERRAGRRPEDVMLIDPANDRFSTSFNPLGLAIDPADSASLVLDSFRKAFGHANPDATPLLERVIRGTAVTLASNHLTLLEAYEFLSVDNHEFRSTLLANVSDEFVLADWREFEKLSRTERLAMVQSARNRFQRLYQSPRVQRIVGQTENAIDFQSLLDGKRDIVVSLSTLPAETQRMLGALIIGGLYDGAKRRNPRRCKDWWVIIDEAASVLTPDLVNSLDEARKFGLRIVALHQRLQQLQREDADLASALLTNARCRVVFGGLERPEAERMAHALFSGTVDGQRIKHEIHSTKFKPVQGTFEVVTTSHSSIDGEGESSSSGESDGSTQGASESRTRSFSGDPLTYRADDEYHWSDGEGESESSSRSWSSSNSRSRHRAETNGESRSIVPVTGHKEFRELSSRTYFTVAEEWERLFGLVSSLPAREVLIRLFNGPVHRLRTLTVDLDSDEETTSRFKERVLKRDPHVKPAALVNQQIEERRARLKGLINDRRPTPVRSFRE